MTLASRKHKNDAITLDYSEVVLALAANTTAASSTARPVPGWKPGMSRFLPKTSESADVFARNSVILSWQNKVVIVLCCISS